MKMKKNLEEKKKLQDVLHQVVVGQEVLEKSLYLNEEGEEEVLDEVVPHLEVEDEVLREAEVEGEDEAEDEAEVEGVVAVEVVAVIVLEEVMEAVSRVMVEAHKMEWEVLEWVVLLEWVA